MLLKDVQNKDPLKAIKHVRRSTGVDGAVFYYYFKTKSNNKLLLKKKNDFELSLLLIL